MANQLYKACCYVIDQTCSRGSKDGVHNEANWFIAVSCFSQSPDSGTHQLGFRKDQYCSCGMYEQYWFPCIYMIFVLNQLGLTPDHLISSIWSKNAYLAANVPNNPDFPLTLISELEVIPMREPLIKKKWERSKKNRIESQSATRTLDIRPRRLTRCSRCHQLGHNRRSCSTNEPVHE